MSPPDDADLRQWLDLSEQYTHLLVANRGNQATPERSAAMERMREGQIFPLWDRLLTRYRREQLDAWYNDRCAAILGRTYVRHATKGGR